MAKAAKGAEPIQALLKQDRKFRPPTEFVKRALVKSESVYREAPMNPVRFWERRAKELTRHLARPESLRQAILTGRSILTSPSPATAPNVTATATSGCSAASTTS